MEVVKFFNTSMQKTFIIGLKVLLAKYTSVLIMLCLTDILQKARVQLRQCIHYASVYTSVVASERPKKLLFK